MASPDPHPGALVASLGTWPRVTLSGPDACRFANGMFTNNVRDLPPGHSQRTGLTDDRGRLWALAELHRLGEDTIRLHLDGRSAEAFVARYDTYIVFDDVVLHPDAQEGWTVQGREAPQVLRDAGLPIPDRGQHRSWEDGLIVSRDRTGAGTGFDLWGPCPFPIDPLGQERLEALEITAAQVRMAHVVPPGLPHEHGLRDAILHFEKGCYLGQESIHRIDVMGRPRRALAVVSGVHLELGSLYADGKAQGTLTRVAKAPDGSCVGLAVVRRPYDAIDTVLSQESAGPAQVIAAHRG